MISLSAIIITYNEEHNLGRCLESLSGLVEEIVVVDSFSTDGTKAIAEQYGATFVTHKFEGHIQQKNFALTQATNDYVLSLDADEAVSDKMRESILKAKQKWDSDGYTFNRLSSYCGKFIRHGNWYPDRKLRLFDARKGKWAGINPHDKFELSADSTTRHLQGDILHYTYNTIEEHKKQSEYFSGISAQEAYNRGRKAGYFKVLVHPAWKFFRGYILRLGFLDGYYGLIIGLISSHETYLKYTKLRKLHRKSAQ